MTPNIVHSIRDRLLSISRQQRTDYNRILSRYAIERFMYRLSISEYADRFVLKGAMLFSLWFGNEARPTKDIDFLGKGEFSFDLLRSLFFEVCKIEVPEDGIIFETDSIEIKDIREGELYNGLQATIASRLGSAALKVSVDVGFGDAVFPSPRKEKYPTLLDMPAPIILVYPPETVIAEKFDAVLALGMRNSRMKDYFELWTLSQGRDFNIEILLQSIKQTIERRGRQLPTEVPVGLTSDFATDPQKQLQWNAFLRRLGVSGDEYELERVVSNIREFLEPIISP